MSTESTAPENVYADWVTRVSRECASQSIVVNHVGDVIGESAGDIKFRAGTALEELRKYNAHKASIERELAKFIYDLTSRGIEWNRNGRIESSICRDLEAGIENLIDVELMFEQMQEDLPKNLDVLRGAVARLTALKDEYDALGADKK